ncbi:MAG: aspartate aminotransferase family protein [Candidatus Margulisbacteria bacterium]|nr:aspartate aminotransferase family protein [Candidatus Margulisiibacteriota bacterium]
MASQPICAGMVCVYFTQNNLISICVFGYYGAICTGNFVLISNHNHGLYEEVISISKGLVSRAKQVLSPVLSHFFEIEIEKGEGCYLMDFQGNAYLDFAAGVGVASTGHCHPKVVKAIQTQSQILIHACAGIVYYEPNIALAEKIGSCLDGDLSSFFFTQSGTEAVEAAIKLAKFVSKKTDVITFKGGFHGRTLGALSITSSKESYRVGYDPLLPQVEFFPFPYEYRNPWDAGDCKSAAIKAFKAFIEPNKEHVCAVIIEPILGEGGYVPAPPEFLNELNDICKEHHIFLILDEIQTGFGRTGKWMAYQHETFTPDILVMAKGIASGMPLGAVVSRPDIMDQWTAGAHGGTYTGNPVSCAAGLATIDVIEEVLPGVSSLGDHAIEFLRDALADHPYVGDIRGKGLMIGIEFVTDKSSKAPYLDIIKPIMNACLDQFLIVISCGVHQNVIRLVPPLIIEKEMLMKGLKILVSENNAHR